MFHKQCINRLLIAGLHFPSKRYAENRDREIVAEQFMDALCEAQSEAEHKKVIIAGDFNADPFEEVMLKRIIFMLCHMLTLSKISVRETYMGKLSDVL